MLPEPMTTKPSATGEGVPRHAGEVGRPSRCQRCWSPAARAVSTAFQRSARQRRRRWPAGSRSRPSTAPSRRRRHAARSTARRTDGAAQSAKDHFRDDAASPAAHCRPAPRAPPRCGRRRTADKRPPPSRQPAQAISAGPSSRASATRAACRRPTPERRLVGAGGANRANQPGPRHHCQQKAQPSTRRKRSSHCTRAPV
jgi:hypothetical protein